MSDRAVMAFVEVPRGRRNEYEVDPVRGGIRLDRVLYSPLHYPADWLERSKKISSLGSSRSGMLLPPSQPMRW